MHIHDENIFIDITETQINRMGGNIHENKIAITFKLFNTTIITFQTCN